MIKRGGVSWPVDERISSFFEEMRSAERRRRGEEMREGVACSPLGEEPSMKAPDPASHTVERSALGERGELG